MAKILIVEDDEAQRFLYQEELVEEGYKVVLAKNGKEALIGHAASHRLDIPLILITGVAVLIGGNLGARVSMKVKTKMIRSGLGLLMWALAAQLLVKLLGYM